MWAESAPGYGADFIVDVPATPSAFACSAVCDPIVPSVEARVRVVNDEPLMRASDERDPVAHRLPLRHRRDPREATALLGAGVRPIFVMTFPGIDPESFEGAVRVRWPQLIGRLRWITDEPERDRPAGGGTHLE